MAPAGPVTSNFRSRRAEFPGAIQRPAEPGWERAVNFAALTQRMVLEELGPAAVLINRKYEILYFLGATSRYLDLPTGEPTRDLMTMAREGLRTKLRAAVHKAMRENKPVMMTDVQVKLNGNYLPVAVTIKPVPAPRAAEGLLLVTFRDQPEIVPSLALPVSEESVVQQLENELRATKEELQTTIGEAESSNEELKASNEEVMSMNEELQSANEELETSKEELQSLNEELTTVNNQLQEKVHELESANNDITNLLNCTDIATVFLDLECRIKRFTPAATQLFNFVGSDLGRPLGDITARFIDPDLLTDAQLVLRQLNPHEKEVPIPDGGWCSRRIMPYRTRDNRVEGVVMTFVDISERKRAADSVVRHLAAVVESSVDAIITEDLDGTIRTWNHGAEQLYGYTHDAAVGQSVKLIVPDDHAEEWADIMARVRRGENITQLETEHVHKGGERIAVSLTIVPIRDGAGKVVSAAAIAHDITERKQDKEALRQNAKRMATDLAAMARLQDLSTRLVQSGDSTSLLLEIVDAAIALTAADMGNIQLYERAGGTLRIAASRGFERPFLEFFNAVGAGPAARGAAPQTGARVVIDDVATSPIFAGTDALGVLLAAQVRASRPPPCSVDRESSSACCLVITARRGASTNWT